MAQYQESQYDYEDPFRRDVVTPEDFRKFSPGTQGQPQVEYNVPAAGGDAYQGFESQWAPGATAPSNAPAGAEWNKEYAMYKPKAGAAAGPAGAGSVQQFIQQWQQTHPASEGIGPLSEALKAAGLGGDRFMYGATPSDNELLVNGEKYKVLGGENTPGAYWYSPGMDDSVPGGGMAAFSRGGGAFAGGMPSMFGGGMGGDANKLFQLLMSRAQQGLEIDPNDPIIRRQADAYSAAQGRSQKNYESALAERLGEHANMGAERRMGAERVGQATSAFEAQLMGQELAARRQEIQAALSGAMGFLSAQQAMQLQEELAQLTLAQNAYQFDVNDQFRNSPLGS